MNVRDLPRSPSDLRKQLVNEILLHPQTYNFKLDRMSRKEFKLMKCYDQLPSVELLLIASHLYKKEEGQN